jgi:hypothetical protein
LLLMLTTRRRSRWQQSRQRDGAFSIHEAGNVGGRSCVEHLDGTCEIHAQTTRDREKRNGRRNGGRGLVEAAGQRFHPFRGGLDYAFIPFGMRGVLSARRRILVPAHPLPGQRAYESLQGRPEVGPLPTPRRCHAVRASRVRYGDRVRRCEPRFHSALSGRGDHADRTRVREP